MQELYDYLTKTLSHKEALEYMDGLSNKIINQPTKFTNDLLDFIHEQAIELMICPDCFGDLSTKTYKEYRGECHGFPSYEEMCEVYCEECGWSNED